MKDHYVHPNAIVDDGAIIGEGSRVWQFTHVMGRASVGRNVSLGQNVFIADHVTIGHECKVLNNVSIYEGVVLEELVFCGPSMGVHQRKEPSCRPPCREGGLHGDTGEARSNDRCQNHFFGKHNQALSLKSKTPQSSATWNVFEGCMYTCISLGQNDDNQYGDMGNRNPRQQIPRRRRPTDRKLLSVLSPRSSCETSVMPQ